MRSFLFWSLLLGFYNLGCSEEYKVDIKKDDGSGVTVIEENKERGTKTIYTSMHELIDFFEKEKQYVEDIRIIVEKKLVDIETQGSLGAYVSSFEDVIGMQDEDETFLHNPLNAYQLIRHVAVGWGIVAQSLSAYREKYPGQLPKRVRRVLAREKRDHVPGAEDLDGVSAGLVRLHDFYKFNLTSFVEEGVIETSENRFETAGELSVWDAFKIGVKGSNMMILGSGIDIMMEGLEKAKREGLVSTPPFVDSHDLKTLKNLIKTAKTVHDQKLDRWGPLTFQHSTNPVPYDKRLSKKKKFSKIKPLPIMLNNLKLIDTIQETHQYRLLCKGEDLRSQNLLKDLTCRYEDRGLPYYRYGPRKIETVSLRPHIVIIHDFITHSEREEYIKSVSSKLRRSGMVGKLQNGTSLLDDRRVSEQGWISEDEVPAARRVTDRINSYLNLLADSTTHSELYQVANYGIAGQYSAHYDQVLMGSSSNSLMKRDVFNIYAGDRMATIMGYLSDVEAGGYTVFPFVGAFVKPKKGSIVLWWNMDKAGGYDVMTRHGGCPVLVGSKWITNKWVRSNSQMFKRPCPKYTGKQIRKFRNSESFQKGGWFTDP